MLQLPRRLRCVLLLSAISLERQRHRWLWNSRFAPVSVGRDKNRKNPLRRMQNVSYEPWTLYPFENPSSKLGYFQTATSSPYRVLHPAQGDKQKKQTSSSTTRNTSSVTVMLYTIPFLRWIHLLCTSTHRMVYFCLSPCRGWMPSVKRCCRAFGLGVKSLLL